MAKAPLRVALAALALGVGLVGCRPRRIDRAATCECAPSASGVVDPSLLAFLSKARALHHEADLAEDRRDLRLAVAALERLTAGPFPATSGGRLSPEVEEVLADTYARIADLCSALGEFDRALAADREGLAHAVEPTYFRGHLFEVLGLVEERHAEALERAGEKEQASSARARSLDASEEAIKLQEGVIRKSLEVPR